jgi:hypothetical protein
MGGGAFTDGLVSVGASAALADGTGGSTGVADGTAYTGTSWLGAASSACQMHPQNVVQAQEKAGPVNI